MSIEKKTPFIVYFHFSTGMAELWMPVQEDKSRDYFLGQYTNSNDGTAYPESKRDPQLYEAGGRWLWKDAER